MDERSGWTRYDYDADGREAKRVQSFKDSPVTALDSEARVIETTRSVDPVTSVVTELEVEKVLGAVVGRQYLIYDNYVTTSIVCLSPTATQADPANLVTVTARFAAGPLSLTEKSTINADGTMSLTEYSYDGSILVVTRSTGQPNTAKTAVIDGTRTVTRTNRGGVAVDAKAYDIATGLQIAGAEVTEFDSFGRAVKTEYLDGTSESSVHACCNGADSVTDKMGITTTYTHDKLGRVLTETRQGITNAYTYDAEGRRLSHTRIGTDASAIVQETNSYDWAGDLTSKRDPYNYTTTYSHPGNNPLISQETRPDGGVVTTESYLDGSQKSVSGSASRPTGTDYLVEGNNRVTKTVSGSTCVNCPSTEWVKTYTDMAGRQVRTVYPDASQSLEFYNAKGQLWKSVDPDGIATLIEYDGQGRKVKQVVDMDRDDVIDLDATDRIAATDYSVINSGGVVKIKQALSEWQTLNQDIPTVVQTSEKSVTGLDTWTSRFGLVTHSTTMLDGDGTRTETVTNPDGSRKIQISTGDRVLESKKLDSASVQIEKTTYTYDAHGRVDSTTDARNGSTNYQYYNNDQIKTITLPAADTATPRQQQKFIYDTMNRVKQTTLADASKTYNEYFLTGDLKRTWGSQTYEQAYTYDLQGRRKTLTTDGARKTTWNYDAARGWLASKLYADEKGTSYTYTSGGKLKTRTWARGIVTEYDYSNAGELTSMDYSDATPDVTFLYNRRGLKESVFDAPGERSLFYNIAGSVTQESITSGVLSGIELYTLYDTYLRKERSEHLGSEIKYDVTYGYDFASRLKSIETGENWGGGPGFVYEYEANSSLIKSLLYTDYSEAEVMKTTRQHDNLNRVISLQTKRLSDNQTLSSHNYDYNSLNQRETITAADDSYWDYDYDTLGQVTSGKKKLPGGQPLSGYDFGYQFDGIGNRITADVNGNVQQYTANNLNQYEQRTVPGAVDIVGEATSTATVQVNNGATYRQGKYFHGEAPVTNTVQPQYPLITVTAGTGAGATSAVGNWFVPKTPELYTYDFDGNLLTDGRWSYTWDGENRLIGMETLASVPAAAKKKISYQYDYMGRRITKSAQEWDVQTATWREGLLRTFFYDGWNLFGEMEDGDVVGTYTWGLDLSGDLQGAGGVGGLLSTSSGGAESYAVADANGNVMKLVTQADIIVVGDYEYGPFGELLRMTGPAAKANHFRFSSKYQEPESGLLYYGYRYYNSEVGQWINRDPITERGGLNLFGFVNNNGINRFDILGLSCCEDCGKKPEVVDIEKQCCIKGKPVSRLEKEVVQVCIRPADIPLGGYIADNLPLYHMWIKTKCKEIGLGPDGGGVPQGIGGSPFDPTSWNPHDGESNKPGAYCIPVAVNKCCINETLALGSTGISCSKKDCNDWTRDKIAGCSGNWDEVIRRVLEYWRQNRSPRHWGAND